MSFGENLQTVRKRNQLSQEELAELLGVSRQAVSKWESGEGYPEVQKLLILSKRMNVSLDVLLETRNASAIDGSSTKEMMVLSPDMMNGTGKDHLRKGVSYARIRRKTDNPVSISGSDHLSPDG